MNAPKRSQSPTPSLCQMIQRNSELELMSEMALAAYFGHIAACPVCREIYPHLLPENFSQQV